MISLEIWPEKRKTPQAKPFKEIKINLLDPRDPSGILKKPVGEEDEALTEMNQIVGVEPTLLGS